MLHRLLTSFNPRNLPLMTRQSYRRELVVSLTMPVAVSLVEGNFVGVLAKKVFAVSDVQLALIVAAPMFANLASFAWARLGRGHRKVRFISSLMTAVLVTVCTIGMLPITPLGAWGLTGLIVLARCLIVGVLTLRSTVWRHNYPRHVRGQITGRLAMLVSLILLIVPFLGSLLLEFNQHNFRLLYPAAVLVALIGVLNFAKVRLRRERALLRYERRTDTRPERRGDAAPLWEYDDRAANPGFWSVLRADPLFRKYMTWQFLAGFSNMMGIAVTIKFVTERTEGMAWDFLVSTSLTQLIPALLMIISLPVWARLFDRIHIVQYRIYQSTLWAIAHMFVCAGVFSSDSLVLCLVAVGLGRFVLGVAQGGGALAWHLGHNDFASREMVAVYMGVHVTLTGVRGALAPFVGIMLFSGWPSFSIAGWTAPGYDGMGAYVFTVAVLLNVIAIAGFFRLRRQVTGGAQG